MQSQNNFIGEPITRNVHYNAEKNRKIKNPRIGVNLGEDPANRDYNSEKKAHQNPGFSDVFRLFRIERSRHKKREYYNKPILIGQLGLGAKSSSNQSSKHPHAKILRKKSPPAVQLKASRELIYSYFEILLNLHRQFHHINGAAVARRILEYL